MKTLKNINLKQIKIKKNNFFQKTLLKRKNKKALRVMDCICLFVSSFLTHRCLFFNDLFVFIPTK